MAIYKATDPPASYTKLYSGNWLLKYEGDSPDFALYSTDQGASWCQIDKLSGKIEIQNAYLYVEDDANLYCWELSRQSVAVFD